MLSGTILMPSPGGFNQSGSTETDDVTRHGRRILMPHARINGFGKHLRCVRVALLAAEELRINHSTWAQKRKIDSTAHS